MDSDLRHWMSSTIAAVQPWCDEPLLAAGTFQVAGGWASGVSSGLIGALVGSVFRRTPKHVRERTGGLPDTVIIAVGPTKVFVFTYRVKRMQLRVEAPVRVWWRDDLVVDTDTRKVASKLTIDVASTGDHHELESTSMTGRLGKITKEVFRLLEETSRPVAVAAVERAEPIPPRLEVSPPRDQAPPEPPSKRAVEKANRKTQKRRRLGEIADEIEAEMRQLRWWQDEPPSEETVLAGGAFGQQTVAFTQWLQVVFVKRLRQAAAGEFEIPSSSSVSTMAVREFDGYPEDVEGLMDLLHEVDRLV